MRIPLMEKNSQETLPLKEEQASVVEATPNVDTNPPLDYSGAQTPLEYSKIISEIIHAPFSDSHKATIQNLLSSALIPTPALLSSLPPLFSSPYLLFFSSKLRSLLFKALLAKTPLPKESRLLAAELIQQNFCPLDSFCDSLVLYSSLDSSRIGRVTFRNSFLMRLLELFMGAAGAAGAAGVGVGTTGAVGTTDTVTANTTANTTSTTPTTANYSKAFELLPNSPQFLEFLTKNISPSSSAFLFLYSCYFLSSINVDLLSIKSTLPIKDLNDSVISKVFFSFSSIYSSLLSDSSYSSLLTSPFKSTSLRSVLLSVYKRLFFFFLLRNRRIFYSIKVFNVFNKTDRSFIYKCIKKHTKAFINIFKQIDPEYLIRRIKNEAQAKEVTEELLLSVKEEKLKEEELRSFYSCYFLYLERNRKVLKIKGINLEIFSIEFNKRLDKSFIRFIELSGRGSKGQGGVGKGGVGGNTTTGNTTVTPATAPAVTLNILKFINSLTLNAPINNSINILNCINIDPVDLVSFLVDSPLGTPLPLDSPLAVSPLNNILYFNLLLQIIYNLFPFLNTGLVMRILPVARKLLIYKEYIFNAGRLYNKIYQKYSFPDPLYDTIGDSKTPGSILIMAAINHPQFRSLFLSASMQLCPPLVFYLDFDPEFSLSFPFMAEVLSLPFRNPTMENISLTGIFLRVLNGRIGGEQEQSTAPQSKGPPLAPHSFVTRNIKAIQDLLFYSQNGIFPFEEDVLNILFDSLKNRIILPCMGIPYICIRNDCSFIYKNYKDSCINCINDMLYVLCKRIKVLLGASVGEAGQEGASVGEAGQEATVQATVQEATVQVTVQATVQSVNSPNTNQNQSHSHKNTRDLDSINEIFNKELSCNFIYLTASRVSIKKTIERINYQNNRLVVYAVLRYLREFGKKEKEMIIKQINESVGEEGVFEMVEKARKYYEKEPKGKLPVEYLFM